VRHFEATKRLPRARVLLSAARGRIHKRAPVDSHALQLVRLWILRESLQLKEFVHDPQRFTVFMTSIPKQYLHLALAG
jgi:hypothetical protein